MKILCLPVFGVLLLLLTAASADIPGSSGTGAVLLSKIPADARNQSLAGSAVAYQKGAESLFNNPAGLAFTENINLISTYNKWLVDYHYIYLGGAYKLGTLGMFGVNMALLNKGSFEITRQSETVEENVTLNDFSLSVGYGSRIFIKNIPLYLGATINYVSENLYSRMNSALLCDMGGIYVLQKDKLQVGLTIKNIGLVLGNGPVFDNKTPFELSGGLFYNTFAFEHYNLRSFLSLYYPLDSKPEVRIGNELTIFKDFIVRQGVRLKIGGYDLDLLSAFSFGAGYSVNRNFQVDVGYNNYEMLGHNYIITLNASF